MRKLIEMAITEIEYSRQTNVEIFGNFENEVF